MLNLIINIKLSKSTQLFTIKEKNIIIGDNKYLIIRGVIWVSNSWVNFDPFKIKFHFSRVFLKVLIQNPT